jgi:hypothetical protein
MSALTPPAPSAARPVSPVHPDARSVADETEYLALLAEGFFEPEPRLGHPDRD